MHVRLQFVRGFLLIVPYVKEQIQRYVPPGVQLGGIIMKAFMCVLRHQFRIVKVLVSTQENVGRRLPALIVVLRVNTSGLPTFVHNVMSRYVKEIVSLSTTAICEISTPTNDDYYN